MTIAPTYADAYSAWMRDPPTYWASEAHGITWTKPWDKVFDPSLGAFGQWFAGGMLNTCHNCLDRHVETGRGDQSALIHDSPMTASVKVYSYADLLTRTAKLAGALAGLGVTKGDPALDNGCQHTHRTQGLVQVITAGPTHVNPRSTRR